MLENEAKGWYGSYSLAGRRSAEKFNNILRKNEILNGDTKKIKVPDMFAPDEMKPNQEENKLDYYQIYSLNADKLKKKIKQIYNEEEENKTQKERKKMNLDFHNKHCSLDNKRTMATTNNEPGCTRYSPNYNYIWPKLITGIKWSDQIGRYDKQIQVDNRDFIINNLENYDKYIINSGSVKCFVNMGNVNNKKNFLKKKCKMNITLSGSSNTKRLTKTLNKKAIKTSNNFYHSSTSVNNEKLKVRNSNLINKKNKSNNNWDDEISSNVSKSNKLMLANNFLGKTKNNFFNESKLNKNSKKNKTMYLESKQEEDNISNIYPIKLRGPVPNFAKLPARTKKVKTYRIENIPFINPKYDVVQERSLTMAIYKKDRNIKKYKPIHFEGMIMGLDYDPDKIIEKYNNHQSQKVPNFKNMTSRPNKKGSPLPSFLQKVYDRSASYLTTDKSLKLNYFPEGKYIPASNSFFPKRSYNKIINLKMVNSKMFLQQSTDEDIQKKKNEVTQKLKLENADYEELKIEGLLNKFDNFSYKTILRKKPKEGYKKLLISFECEEKEEGEE